VPLDVLLELLSDVGVGPIVLGDSIGESGSTCGGFGDEERMGVWKGRADKGVMGDWKVKAPLIGVSRGAICSGGSAVVDGESLTVGLKNESRVRSLRPGILS
jgi:hypothetical protein